MKLYQIILEPGANPASHEIRTAEVLARYGAVRFICPSHIPGTRTPDVHWMGRDWEIKAPKGVGRDLLVNTLNRAARQSENIIIDLSRTRVPEPKICATLRHKAPLFRKIKRLKVVTKAQRIIDIKGGEC